jgi:hypothetical protein
MWKLLKLFGIYPKDWVQLWTGQGIWKYQGVNTDYSYYHIDWSESRGEFRLRCSGVDPLKHPYYYEANKVLNKLNIDNMSDPQVIRDKKIDELLK